MSAPDSRGTSRSRHWTRLGERGVYLGLRATLLAYSLFGRAGFSLLLYPVVGYFFLTGRTARRASTAYLCRIHRNPMSSVAFDSPPGWRESFRHMVNFGEAVLDKAVSWTGGIPIERLNFDNAGAFDDACKDGRGAVLIASHLGNVAVCHALGSRHLAQRINVVVNTRHAETFNRLLREINPESAMSLVQVADVGPETAIMLRERISLGELLVIVGDRTPRQETSRVNWVPFLGSPAPFPQGPFMLAAMLRCPVLTLFCFKAGDHYHLHCDELGDTSKLSRRERKLFVASCTKKYVEILEHYCLLYPYQWYNFFDFWSQADPLSKARNLLGESDTAEHV